MNNWDFSSIGVAYYYLSLTFLISLATAIVIALVYAGLHRLELSVGQKSRKSLLSSAWGAFPFVLIIGFIGGLAGQLGGGSRDGVVGDLLPAVFTLLGGYIAYYMGEKRDNKGKILVNSVAFLLCFFTMYNVSAVWRRSNENWAFCRDLYSNPEFDEEAERTARNRTWDGYCLPVFAQWTRPPNENPSAPGAATP